MNTLNYNTIIEIIFKKSNLKIYFRFTLYIVTKEWWDPCINYEVLCDKKFKEM